MCWDAYKILWIPAAQFWYIFNVTKWLSTNVEIVYMYVQVQGQVSLQVLV